MNFHIIWQQYEKELTRFVRARIFDKDIVPDIMQEVAIKIFKNKNKLSEIENIRSWLYRVTRNILIDFYKQNDKIIPNEIYELNLITTNEKNKNKELEACIKKIASNLKDKDNIILSLSIFEQFSLKEIALKLNLSIEGAKTKLKRAKKKTAQSFFSCCSIEKDLQGKIVDFKTSNSKSCFCQ